MFPFVAPQLPSVVSTPLVDALEVDVLKVLEVLEGDTVIELVVDNKEDEDEDRHGPL